LSEAKNEKDESSSIPRPSLHTLSDLIFGLALSIGAISLLGQQQADFSQVVISLSFFGFGFYLLVSVWYRHASIMKVLPFETTSLVIVNIVLLFLVSIEPYLLNYSISLSANLSQSIRNPITQLYEIDFGSIYVILAYLLQQLIKQEKKLGRTKYISYYKNIMTLSLVVAAMFYISTLPYFGTINFSYFNLRQIIWISALPIGLIYRVVALLKK